MKQIARRCELTVATTYHLVRTLAYEGYVSRREDGTYVVGLEIADRFRELVVAFRGPSAVGEVLHRAATDTGHSHFLGRFVGGRVALTAVAEGARSPRLDEFVPGFDDGAHATALGKALLATLTCDQRLRYLKDWGMRPFTPSTLTTPETFEADIAAGERRGLQLEIGQFRGGVATAAVVVTAERDLERRLAVACALPAADMMPAARMVRSRLQAVARAVTEAMVADAA